MSVGWLDFASIGRTDGTWTGEGTDGGRGSLIFGNAKAGKPLMQSAQESICR
jgi:hypothetical protein